MSKKSFQLSTNPNLSQSVQSSQVLGDVVLQESSVKGANIGIFAVNVNVSGTSNISATALGCRQNIGYGCGYFDKSVQIRWTCGGTGGSYGGVGGKGTSSNNEFNQACAQITSRGVYGNPYYPIYEGSGGGGSGPDFSSVESQYISSGGGVVYVQAYAWLQVDGSISADGKSVQQQHVRAYFSAGSGSGGSIQVYSVYLNGTGVVSARGGNASAGSDDGGGGNGGGGRIRLFLSYNLTSSDFFTFAASNEYTRQRVIQFLQYLTPVTVDASAGAYGNAALNDQYELNLQNGSVFSSPCPPGYYQQPNNAYFCRPCPLGTFKNSLAPGACTPCLAAPPNSNYIQLIGVPSVSPNCPIACGNSFYRFNLSGGEVFMCLTQSEYFYRSIGGSNGVLAIGLVLGVLLLLAMYRLVRSRNTKELKSTQSRENAYMLNDLPVNDENLQNELKNVPDFLREDLPYHVRRYYLCGENTPEKPWCMEISAEGQTIFKADELEALADAFNALAAYSKWQYGILQVYRFTYLPFYYIQLRQYQESKFRALQALFVSRGEQVLLAARAAVKLGCAPDFSLAYLDIMDYSVSLLNWSNQTKFPLCLVLAGTGTFLSPYNLNLTDPLTKSLLFSFQGGEYQQINYIVNEEAEKKRQERFQAFERFLTQFNKNARPIDYWQKEQHFMGKFLRLFAQVQVENNKLFKQLNIEAKLCIHILADTDYDPQLESVMQKLNNITESEREDLIVKAHRLKNFQNGLYEIKISLLFQKIDRSASDRNSAQQQTNSQKRQNALRATMGVFRRLGGDQNDDSDGDRNDDAFYEQVRARGGKGARRQGRAPTDSESDAAKQSGRSRDTIALIGAKSSKDLYINNEDLNDQITLAKGNKLEPAVDMAIIRNKMKNNLMMNDAHSHQGDEDDSFDNERGQNDDSVRDSLMPSNEGGEIRTKTRARTNQRGRKVSDSVWRKIWQALHRFVQFFKSQFLTYRMWNISLSYLLGMMYLTLIIDWGLLIVSLMSYFMLTGTPQQQDATSDQCYGYPIAELVCLFVIFPLAIFVGPILYLLWMMKGYLYLGKLTLLFSYISIYGHFVLALFAIYDMVWEQNYCGDLSNAQLYGIAKVGVLFTTILLNYFGTHYIILCEEPNSSIHSTPKRRRVK